MTDHFILHLQGWLAVAGLAWRFELTRHRRALRALARSRGHDMYLSRPDNNSDQDGTLLGGVSLNRQDAPTETGMMVSLAMLALPALGADTAAIFRLSDRYWFIATTGGRLSVFSDIVGSAELVRSALARYEQMTPAPDDGRRYWAPAGFLTTPSEEKNLQDVLPASPPLFSRWLPGNLSPVRLLPVSTRNRMAGMVSLTVLVLAGGFLWHMHTQSVAAQQQAERLKARRAKHIRPSVKPWTQQPALTDFLHQCSVTWRRLPLSIAGWGFQEALCGNDSETGKPVLLSYYSRPQNGTVNDFWFRVPAFFPDIHPGFDIPGPGRTGRFVLPVSPATPGTQDTLPDADFATRQLTSYAQSLHATVNIQGADVHDAQPWLVWDFTFTTDVPPDLLFRPDRFRADGVRLASARVSLSEARLHFTLKGRLYAKR